MQLQVGLGVALAVLLAWPVAATAQETPPTGAAEQVNTAVIHVDGMS